MCFHSPYVEFWHLYTFFKLSISKEINIWFYVLCKIEYVLWCCKELQREMFFLGWRWLRAAVVGDEDMLSQISAMDAQPSTNRRGGMAFVVRNKLFSRPTSCDLGLFAICMFFKKKKGEIETEPPGHITFLALVRGWTSECGSTQFLYNLDQISSVVPLPCDFESPFVPTLSALGT